VNLGEFAGCEISSHRIPATATDTVAPENRFAYKIEFGVYGVRDDLLVRSTIEIYPRFKDDNDD
jgi:hypothetical protein